MKKRVQFCILLDEKQLEKLDLTSTQSIDATTSQTLNRKLSVNWYPTDELPTTVRLHQINIILDGYGQV